MLRFVLRTMRAKKWMMLSLLIGNVLLVAIACVNPMYTRAVLQRTLLSDMKAVLTDKNVYPGGVTIEALKVLREEGFAGALMKSVAITVEKANTMH